MLFIKWTSDKIQVFIFSIMLMQGDKAQDAGSVEANRTLHYSLSGRRFTAGLGQESEAARSKLAHITQTPVECGGLCVVGAYHYPDSITVYHAFYIVIPSSGYL